MLSEQILSKKKYLRRKARVSYKINESCKRTGRLRLSVFRSSKHMYAQLMDVVSQRTLVSASTLEIKKKNPKTYNKEAASELGSLIAKKAKKVITDKEILVAFDRGGDNFGPVLEAFANAAKENGLIF